jgi:hypothetical protein
MTRCPPAARYAAPVLTPLAPVAHVDFTPAHQGRPGKGFVYLALLDTQGRSALMGSKLIGNLVPEGAE